MSRRCATPTCENELPERARSTTIYCGPCRSSAHYWSGKSVKQMLYRKAKLAFFGTRLGSFISKKERRT